MHVEGSDLILGLHDLDHVLSGATVTHSEEFVDAFGCSGEMWMCGLTEMGDDRPALEQLRSLGVSRIVIRLDQVMTAAPGLDLGCVPLEPGGATPHNGC